MLASVPSVQRIHDLLTYEAWQVFYVFSKKVRKITDSVKDFFHFHRTYIIYKDSFLDFSVQ